MIGQHILHFESLSSTFDIAWEHAQDFNNHGLVVHADEQTRGRGQRGARWVAPAQKGLLLSALLFPPRELRRPVLLALWSALGVCEVLSRLGVSPELKWPNDVLIEGKKIGGVLVEQRGAACVVGVGLNLCVPQEVFRRAGLFQAASLADFVKNPPARGELLQELLLTWNASYQKLCQGNDSSLTATWKSFTKLEGAMVEVLNHNGRQVGELTSLNLNELRLKTEKGQIILIPEQIQRLKRLESDVPAGNLGVDSLEANQKR